MAVLVFILGAVGFGIYNSHEAGEKEDARIAAMTPEQRASEAKANAAARARADAQQELNGAQVACQMFVEQSLHDPKSAEFENSWTFPIRELAPHKYLVQVKVRAKNGFNALRSTEMNCETAFDGKNWAALSLKQVR